MENKSVKLFSENSWISDSESDFNQTTIKITIVNTYNKISFTYIIHIYIHITSMQYMYFFAKHQISWSKNFLVAFNIHYQFVTACMIMSIICLPSGSFKRSNWGFSIFCISNIAKFVLIRCRRYPICKSVTQFVKELKSYIRITNVRIYILFCNFNLTFQSTVIVIQLWSREITQLSGDELYWTSMFPS